MPIPSHDSARVPGTAVSRPLRVDIFCRIIDNFGDIGVCWRLARRLAHGHGWHVRLWVDDLRVFARLAPAAGHLSGHGMVNGIEIVHWTSSLAEPAPEPGDVVIEAFGCDPPAIFIEKIRPSHVWLNLEYLSAEAWVESCHGLPSPQGCGRVKHFFFPGFTAHTGGLLREPDLLRRRDEFQSNPQAKAAFLAGAGVPGAALELAMTGQADIVSMFCYGDAPLSRLHDMLGRRQRACLLLLAEGSPMLAPGSAQSHIHVVRMPFFSQDDYDRLLWASDVNFVRGEDSFVRAQWAARPLVWHIYPQAQAAHVDKLTAWLKLYTSLPGVGKAHQAWNGECSSDEVDEALRTALDPAVLRPWAAQASSWSKAMANNVELADAISEFCRRRLK